jgi:perosamine synthetase
MIPHNKPTLGKEEIISIEGVIKSGWLVQGPKTKEFEDMVCKYIGLPKGMAVALANGTAALYVALKVLGVGKGDEVIIPTYVCSSLLNVIYLAGATPIIVDINENDFNISFSGIKAKLNKKTKAIIAPHIFGIPADIISMKKELKVFIIEDCAQSIGSKIKENYTGTIGDIGIFSFYTSKMIATGQGGMFVSNNPEYVRKARDFIDFDLGKGEERGKRRFYPRFNFEITDIQSALGVAQLKKINTFIEKRKKIAKAYEEVCGLKGWNFQKPAKDNLFPNNYRFIIKEEEKTIIKLREYLKKNGIDSIIPIEDWELLHNCLELEKKDFRVAEAVSKQTLSLPIYPDLIKQGNFKKIINCLKKF